MDRFTADGRYMIDLNAEPSHALMIDLNVEPSRDDMANDPVMIDLNDVEMDEENPPTGEGQIMTTQGYGNVVLTPGDTSDGDTTDDDFTIYSSDDELMSYEELLELLQRVGSVTVGLDPQTFAALQLIAFEKQDDEGDGERCIVCLEDYEDGEIVLQLPCSHIFHGHCATEWFKRSKICPLCRREVVIKNK